MSKTESGLNVLSFRGSARDVIARTKSVAISSLGRFLLLSAICYLLSAICLYAEDAEIKLNSSDGSTCFVVQDKTGLVVSSITSVGNAYFKGNLGIGTISPTQKLDIVGTAKATAFQGDGAGLTNVTGVDTNCRISTGALRNELVTEDNTIKTSTGTLVKKAGDTMTGTLTMGTGGSIAMGNQNITNAGTVEGNILQDNDDDNIVIQDTCTVQGFMVVNGTVCINAATPPTSLLNLYVVGVSSFNGNVNIAGTLTAASKNFVQDHPTDPTKQIVYVCLEGGEAGTYIRGSGQLKNGEAKISLPEHFSLVTNENGITAVVTPLNDCKGIYAVKKTNKEIIVKELQSGESNAKFDYLVHGIRAGYENHQVIRTK